MKQNSTSDRHFFLITDKPKILHRRRREIGRPHLPQFLSKNIEKLACDVMVISDSDMWDRGVPVITYSLRGLCALEVSLKTANTDLHSGMFGGGVQNANHLLEQLLSTFHDENGKVSIDQFYDDVLELTEFEKEQMVDFRGKVQKPSF
jgi:acetylornithine deacetylase/succinyl-diaminopimelate desuccinylase-like protein